MGTYTNLSKAIQTRSVASESEQLKSPEVEISVPTQPQAQFQATHPAKPVEPTPSARLEAPSPSNHDTTAPSNHDTVTPRHHDTKVTDLTTFVQALLQEKSVSASTYRFPAQLMDRLDDVHYQLRKPTNGRERVSKNDLVIAGLASALLDFEQNGTESLLYRLFVQDLQR